MSIEDHAKFHLGQLVATTHAASVLSNADVSEALQRHAAGDWGDIPEEDRIANEVALVQDLRLMSVYNSSADITFWIITEHDRSMTTVLLPEDY